MRKLYCDRCHKEVDVLVKRRVPYRVTQISTVTKDVEVCRECDSFLSKVEKEYNTSMARVRIEFFKTLFPAEVFEKEVRNNEEEGLSCSSSTMHT